MKIILKTLESMFEETEVVKKDLYFNKGENINVQECVLNIQQKGKLIMYELSQMNVDNVERVFTAYEIAIETVDLHAANTHDHYYLLMSRLSILSAVLESMIFSIKPIVEGVVINA